MNYNWQDNATESGVAICDTDVLNECLMHLKYENFKFNINPYSISSGAKLNGQANILFVQNGGGIDVTGEVEGLTVTQETSTVTRDLGGTKTLTSITVPYSLRAYGLINYWTNSSSNCKVSIVHPDDSETEVLSKSKGATGTGNSYLNGTEVIDFETPVQAKAIKITVFAGRSVNLTTMASIYAGYATVSNITYTQRNSSSSANTLYFNVGSEHPNLTAYNAQGGMFELSHVEELNISTYADGLYYVFVHPNGTASAYSNYYGQPDAPSSPLLNDIWLDTSTSPLKCKRYFNSTWVDFDGVYCGNITVSSGLVTSVRQPYFGVPRLTQANGVVPRTLVYTYTNGTEGYDVYNDGYCEQCGRTAVTADITLTKTYKNTNFNVLLGTSKSANNSNDTVTIVNENTIHIVGCTSTAGTYVWWRTCGYLAINQY